MSRLALRPNIFLLILYSSIAQCRTSGIIEGVVKDKTNKATLAGVTLRLEGTMQGAVSDAGVCVHIECKGSTCGLITGPHSSTISTTFSGLGLSWKCKG